jgi:hypothetical protein
LEAMPDEQITAEQHFSSNINQAWLKLDEYYTKLDNTPVYVAAIVLHPRMRWNWFTKAWRERPDWLKRAKQSFNDLLLHYSNISAIHSAPPQTQSPQSGDCSDSDDDELSTDIEQQLADFNRDKAGRHTVLNNEKSPIPYWIANRLRWPQLAQLALDIYSIPVMSDEPERVFSITGAAITPRRRSLLSYRISHTMCLKAWQQAGLIEIDM